MSDSIVIFKCEKCGNIKSLSENYDGLQKISPVEIVCLDCQDKETET